MTCLAYAYIRELEHAVPQGHYILPRTCMHVHAAESYYRLNFCRSLHPPVMICLFISTSNVSELERSIQKSIIVQDF